MICGIYSIRNKVTNQQYVGQSIDIQKRFTRHKYELNKGIHKNGHLQNAWNKYGKSAFEFYIIIECFQAELNAQEELEYRKHKSESLYNILEDFSSLRGDRNPFFGKKHSETTKHAMTKLNEVQVREIKTALKNGKTHLDISLQYNVSRTVIARINSGTRWSHVEV